jgi:glycosyltransferase involved in cell wall biosynthesis
MASVFGCRLVGRQLMKVLFVHDHFFRVDSDGNVYSPGQLPFRAWKRYLEHFSEVRVFARALPVTNVDKLDVSSGADVSFILDHGYSGPRDLFLSRSSIRDALQRAVAGVDAVIIRLPSELGLFAQSVAQELNVPCAIEVVGCAYDAYANYGNLIARGYAQIAFRRMQRAVHRASHAIYVTRRFLQSRYPNEGVTGFASNVQLAPVQDDVLEKRLSRIKERKAGAILGFIGSLKVNYKGLDVALSALAGIRARGAEVELRVLGDGDPARWRDMAKEVGVASLVRFDGVLPAGEPVMRWLDEIDIYLQPSKQEGLPRSSIEAMSRGLPVLASTAGGIPELLDPACLHRPGDFKTLARQLEGLMGRPEEMLKQAQRNWSEAKAYEAPRIEEARRAFWGQFADYVRSGGKPEAAAEFDHESPERSV